MTPRLKQIQERVDAATVLEFDMTPAVRNRHEDTKYLLAFIESQAKEIEALRVANNPYMSSGARHFQADVAENGKRELSALELVDCCKLFRTSPNDFLDWHNYKTRKDSGGADGK